MKWTYILRNCHFLNLLKNGYVKNSDGIAPDNLLFRNSSFLKNRISPNSLGILPVSSLSARYKLFNCVNFPSSDGIDPIKSFTSTTHRICKPFRQKQAKKWFSDHRSDTETYGNSQQSWRNKGGTYLNSNQPS